MLPFGTGRERDRVRRRRLDRGIGAGEEGNELRGQRAARQDPRREGGGLADARKGIGEERPEDRLAPDVPDPPDGERGPGARRGVRDRGEPREERLGEGPAILELQEGCFGVLSRGEGRRGELRRSRSWSGSRRLTRRGRARGRRGARTRATDRQGRRHESAEDEPPRETHSILRERAVIIEGWWQVTGRR